MRLLITAGNTLVPIDRVRCITNIFTGRTGALIAREACDRGHQVSLLTSDPNTAELFLKDGKSIPQPCSVVGFCTFDELDNLLEQSLAREAPDVLIHCAAVSDYLAAGIFAPGPQTGFDPATASWHGPGGIPTLVDMAAGKVKSDAQELWLRLVRAPKLIDRVHSDWGFRGILVKFKLEVEVSEERLRDIAEASRCHSAADLMVANTLEGRGDWALLGPLAGCYRRVSRNQLPAELLDAIESLARERSHA